MIRRLAAMALVTTQFSAPAVAACGTLSCDGPASEVVLNVFLIGSGNILLEPPPAERSNLNCTLDQGAFVTLQPTHVRFKEIYAAILYAMATNKRLIVRIVEGSSNCAVSYVRAFS